MKSMNETKSSASNAMTAMVDPSEIRPGLPVVCSKGGQFAVVDHMEGASTIKLNRDEKGQHHYIPLSWVKFVDSQVHVDRPGEQAMREWSLSPMTDESGDKLA